MKKNYFKKAVMIGLMASSITLAACGSTPGGETESKTTETQSDTEKVTEKDTQKESQKETQNQTQNEISKVTESQSLVDISKIEPNAAKEVQSQLDDIAKNIKTTSKKGDTEVIKEATNVMAMAVGNSLSEDQIKLVVKNWKQQKTDAELKEFETKFATIHSEYEVLKGTGAEAELKKAGLSITDKDYCGKGSLDMVDWIKKSL